MKIQIENFRGVKSANYELDKPFVLVYGDNEAGKSSSFYGIHAAINGAIDFPGVKQNMSSQLVTRGESKSKLIAKTETGTTTVTLGGTKPTTKTTGDLGLSVHQCSTMLDPTELPQKEKDRFFAELLNSSPTKEQLQVEIGTLCGDKFDNVWQTVKAQGWDVASSYYAGKATEQKGVWRDIAGEAYGSDKVKKWAPDNWNPDLDGASEEQLRAKIVEAKEFEEAAISANAVEGSELEKIEEIISEKEDVLELLKDAQEEYDELMKVEFKERPSKLDAGEKGSPCPECGSHLVMDSGKLRLADVSAYTSADIEARADEIKRWDSERKEHQEKLTHESNMIAKFKHKLSEIEKAETRLDEIKKKVMDNSKGGANDLNRARNELKAAKDDLDAFTRYKKAEKAARAVEYYDTIAKALAPSGVRKTVLEQALEEFNTKCAEVFPDWVVSLDDELNAHFNGMPLVLCCESEQWRAKVIIRTVVCMIAGAELLLIDRLDILSNAKKNILIKALRQTGLTVVCFCTVDKLSNAKPLPTSWARTYFLTNGESNDISDNEK